MRVASLYRYPVKGLSPQALDFVDLETGDYFPGDRLFALKNGPSGFDAANPIHQPKIKFLMLMKNAPLAGLSTHYDEASYVLRIAQMGKVVARGDLRTDEGREAIERFLNQISWRGDPRSRAGARGASRLSLYGFEIGLHIARQPRERHSP